MTTGTGALDIPTADFWYVRDGKIQEFNCRIGAAANVRTAGRTAGLHLRSRRVRAPKITPTSPEGNP